MANPLAEYEPLDDDNESYISEAERESLASEDLENLADFSKNLEQDLIDERLNLVLNFNRKLISPGQFYTELARIKHELEEIEIVNDDIDEELIEKESLLNEILNKYISKFKELDKQNINFDSYLTSEEVDIVKNLHEQINELRNKYRKIHEEEMDEPYESPIFESIYDSMNELEKEQLKKSAKSRGLKVPEREDYVLLDDYRNAEEDFYEKFKIFIDPNFFEKYSEKERSEIENLAKKLNIVKPKLNEYPNLEEFNLGLNAFYKDVGKLLPGYVYKMNITSIGSSYELIEEKSMIVKINEEMELFKKMIIKPSEEDTIRIKSNKTFSDILTNLDDPYLINCIMSTNPKVQALKEQALNAQALNAQALKSVKVQKLLLRPDKSGKILNLNIPENLKKNYETLLNSGKIEIVNTSILNIPENISKKDYQKVLIAKRIVLVELIEQSKRKKFIKDMSKYKKDLTSQTFPDKISKELRNKSLNELKNILNKVREPELKLNIESLVLKLEEYIYKISNEIKSEYNSRISDIVFILNYYPIFRTKLLNGSINIYQLSLFEKEIFYEAKLHVFSTNVKNRKFVLRQIQDIFNSIVKAKNIVIKNSSILTNFIVNYKSKKLELLIFDVALPSSKTDKGYLNLSRKLLNLLKNVEISIGYIMGEISIEQILQNIQNNISIEATLDYNDFSVREIEALMSQEKGNIDFLNKDRRKIEAINYSGEFVVLWNPNPAVVDRVDISRWNRLKSTLDVKKLKDFKATIMKKYRMEVDPNLGKIYTMLKAAEDKLRILKISRAKNIGKETTLRRIRYINFLKEKYGKLPSPPPPKDIKYNQISYILIFELIQSYKRKLMAAAALKNPNKLIELMEFLDLNKLNYTEGYISEFVFNKLIKQFTLEINQLIPMEIKAFNTMYFKQAINVMLDLFNLKSASDNLDTLTQKIELLVENWPKNYVSSGITDFYENDLFLKLLNISDPIDFYDQKFVRLYNHVVSINTPPKEEIYKRPQVLYNPETNEWGNNAFNGTLYDVHKLDRNPSTKKPIDMIKTVMEKEPRTGMYVPVQITVQLKGKYPFIRVELRTTKEGQFITEWREAPLSAVKMYPMRYDSCSRFTKEPDCNTGVGLKNKNCVFDYEEKICKSSFGKKKKISKVKIPLKKSLSGIKYHLSDSDNIRHKSIQKRIKFERLKKKGTLRNAAVAFKRRLVVLRTYRKKNPKLYKILSKDIKYIDKKYLK